MGHAVHRLAKLSICACATAGSVMAQQVATRVADSAASQTHPNTVRAIVFHDRVEKPGFDPRKWATLGGDVFEAGGETVVRIGCDVPDEAVLITRPLSTAGLADVAVIVDLAPTGDPPPPPLTLEWSDEQSGWRPLGFVDPQSGSGPHSFDLPPLSPAASVRIRLAPRGGPGGWLLKSVDVSGTAVGGWSRVQVDSEPLDGGLFWIITDSILAERRVESPATILATGRSIRLIAPAEVGGHPFLRWDLGGDRSSEPNRGIRHSLDTGQPAVAHYADNPDSGRIADIELDAIPPMGQVFAAALADDPSFVIEPIPAGESLRFLVGESATFAAPPRFERLVFSHWSLDGKPLPHESALLSLPIERSTTLLAVYELLGDMNDDEMIDKNDIESFILALADPVAYEQRFPTIDRLRRGDLNGDGQFDESDIRRFVELVLGE